MNLTVESMNRTFEELVEEHYGTVHAFALSRLRAPHAAEDVTQETFMRAFRSFGRCHGKSVFLSWVLGIASNCVKEEFRKRKRASRPIPPRDNEGEPVELPRAVTSAIEGLRDRPRQVLILKYFDRLSCKEIARRLDMSESSVKVTLCRAYRFIRERAQHEMS